MMAPRPPAHSESPTGRWPPAACLWRLRASPATPRRLDRGDVDFFHAHHRLEGTLCGRAVRIADGFHQCAWRDLPGQAPLVLAPAAGILGAPMADDGIPITIGLGLVFGQDLKRKCLTVLERRATVQTEAGHAHHRKFDGEYLPLLASR